MEENRLFRFPKPQWLNSANSRVAGVYLAGALFSIALFIIIDAAAYSKSNLNGSDYHVNFVDWIPAIFSALGMIVINSIDKTRLSGDSFTHYGDGVAWKARVVLFLGFAAIAGGLAGSVTVLVMKYVVQEVTMPSLWMGIANPLCNGLIMLSSVVLWRCTSPRAFRLRARSVCDGQSPRELAEYIFGLLAVMSATVVLYGIQKPANLHVGARELDK